MSSTPLSILSQFRGWSRHGKVLFSLLAGALCVQGALAFQTMAYPANPCKLADDANFASVEGGCKDLTTGRVWSRNAFSAERTSYTWDFARSTDYCTNLVEGGYDDWRLPNRDEMKAVAANGAGTYLDVFSYRNGNNGAVGVHYGPKWSSTTFKKGRYTYAYTLKLTSGEEFSYNVTGSYFDAVCVR